MIFKKKLSIFALVMVLICSIVYFGETYAEVRANQEVAEQVGPQFKRELQCLAENIYYEAGSESYEGKLAVAQVVLNRANSGKFPESICSVVYQKTGGTYQFSWVGLTKHEKNPYEWEESMLAARKALTEPVAHALLSRQNVLYYHAKYVNPQWHLVKVAQIGNHIFYKENKNGRI